MNLWLIFLTGLTSGGVTCAAMQGGLLASTIANQKKNEGNSWGQVSIFLIMKLFAYSILGGFLGALGGVFMPSLNIRIFFQGLAALFMFASAMNLLEVHPIFRYLAITPPKFARKILKNTTTTSRLFAPGLLGLFTILIPCGVTQAMEILALSSGSAINGALIMGTFVLGTAPVFALIGVATAKLTEVFRVYFLRVAAILLILMALYSMNGILQVIDSPYSLQRVISAAVATHDLPADPNVKFEDGKQKITISVSNSGYFPKSFKVRKDIPVELTLATKGGVYSCATAFTFKAFNISEFLLPSDAKVKTFTPTQKGIFTFACSMGMYSGTMEVL